MSTTGLEHQQPNGQWVDCNDAVGRCKLPKRAKQVGVRQSGVTRANLATVKTKQNPNAMRAIRSKPRVSDLNQINQHYSGQARSHGVSIEVQRRLTDSYLQDKNTDGEAIKRYEIRLTNAINRGRTLDSVGVPDGHPKRDTLIESHAEFTNWNNKKEALEKAKGTMSDADYAKFENEVVNIGGMSDSAFTAQIEKAQKNQQIREQQAARAARIQAQKEQEAREKERARQKLLKKKKRAARWNKVKSFFS